MSVDEALLKAKMVALLHDPMYKLWVITAAFKARGGSIGRVLAKRVEGERVAGDDVEECRGLIQTVPWADRAHLAEAVALARNVLEGVIGVDELQRLWGIAERADHLASAFDRWLLPPEAEKGRRVVAPSALVNPFNPRYKLALRDAPPVDKVCSYVRLLAEAVKDAYDRGGVVLAYHTLYALLEPLWYTVVGDYVSPADTRVPTHTVFDHLYASAAAVNWVYEESRGSICGILGFVDLASVQEWVRASRRTGDMWAASWLASALAWAAVRRLVETYGPDVMVLPTARLNPFYLSWLANQLREEGASKALNRLQMVMEKLGLLKTIVGVEERGGKRYYLPLHPVMPATLTLMLPCENTDFEVLIRDSYVKAWREIVKDLEEWLEEVEEISTVLEKVGDEPPFPLRVVAVRVDPSDKEFKEFVGKVGAVYPVLGERWERLLYVYALSRLGRKVKKTGLVSVVPGVTYSAELTSLMWGNGRRYRECTMCGRRPALPDEHLSPLKTKGVVDEHEHLCPYCLVKRLTGRGLLPHSLSLVHGSLAGLAGFRPRVLAVNIVASLDAVVDVCRLVGLLAKDDVDIGAVRKCLDELEKAYLEVDVPGCERPGSIEDVFELYFRNPACAVRLLKNVVEKVASRQVSESDVERALTKSKRYYALIYGDGDGVGDVIFGFLGLSKKDVEEYWSVIKNVVVDEEARKGIEPSRLLEIVKTVMEQLGEAREKWPATIPTPAYHAALSMALMASAIADITVAKRLGGIIVYAGGDDIIAITPVFSVNTAAALHGGGVPTNIYNKRSVATLRLRTRPLTLVVASGTVWADFVATSRRAFWAIDNTPPGFHRLGEMVVAAPVALGRTYAVVLAHYREPLLLRVADSRRLEKKVKDYTSPFKDAVAVIYGRGLLEQAEAGFTRNTEAKSLLALEPGMARKTVAYPVALIATHTATLVARRLNDPTLVKIVENVNAKPVFSVSLINDLERELETLKTAARLTTVKGVSGILNMLIEQIAERNVISRAGETYATILAETIVEAARFWPKGLGDGLEGYIRTWKYSFSAAR